MHAQSSVPNARARRPAAALTVVLAIALAAAALVSTCGDPQSPPDDPNAAYQAAFEPGALTLRIDGPGGAVLQLVATDVSLDAANDIVTAQVALHNSSRTEIPGPTSILVSDFDPAPVSPVNAACTECAACARVCEFDHRGGMGPIGDGAKERRDAGKGAAKGTR